MDAESLSGQAPDRPAIGSSGQRGEVGSRSHTGSAELRLPSGTVTFLFTDIEGSTSLWDEHPEAMRVSLADHDRALRQSIECNAGYVIKTTGDPCRVRRCFERLSSLPCRTTRLAGPARPLPDFALGADGSPHGHSGTSRRRLLRALAESRRAHHGGGPWRPDSALPRNGRAAACSVARWHNSARNRRVLAKGAGTTRTTAASRSGRPAR